MADSNDAGANLDLDAEASSIHLETTNETTKTSTSTTSSIPTPEATHRRSLQRQGFSALMWLTISISVGAACLIFYLAACGTSDAQRIAFGVIGAVLGTLWSHFGKLMDAADKR